MKTIIIKIKVKIPETACATLNPKNTCRFLVNKEDTGYCCLYLKRVNENENIEVKRLQECINSNPLPKKTASRPNKNNR